MTRRFYPPTQSDIPMHGWRPYSDVHHERIRAHKLHDHSGGSMERKLWDDPYFVTVVGEEFGEVCRALNNAHGIASDAGAMSNAEARTHLRDELIQLAAMTLAWVDAIDLNCDRFEWGGEAFSQLRDERGVMLCANCSKPADEHPLEPVDPPFSGPVQKKMCPQCGEEVAYCGGPATHAKYPGSRTHHFGSEEGLTRRIKDNPQA